MKKIIAIVLCSLAVVCGAAAAVILTHPQQQMTFMVDYVMRSLRDFHWSALSMEDPVRAPLTEALGEENPQTVDALYTYLKDTAGKMTWEIISTDPLAGTAEVAVTYVDGTDFLDRYSAGLTGYIIDAIDSGAMELSGVTDVLEVISDEDNSALFTAAAQQADTETSQTVTVTIYFEKKMGLYLPQTTSDEVNDVVSAGLFHQLDGMTDRVAALLIPRVIERAFHSIQRFDVAELEKLTGNSLSELLGLPEDSPFYVPFVDYLRSCAGKIIYSVGPYRSDTGTVEVACSFLDSQNIVSGYLKKLTAYVFSHLTSPIPTDEENAQLLRSAIDDAEEKRVEKTVTITFSPENYGEFTISDEIRDVASANLQSEVGGLLKGVNALSSGISAGTGAISGLLDAIMGRTA